MSSGWNNRRKILYLGTFFRVGIIFFPWKIIKVQKVVSIVSPMEYLLPISTTLLSDFLESFY